MKQQKCKCNKKTYARGYCKNHYEKLRTKGKFKEFNGLWRTMWKLIRGKI